MKTFVRIWALFGLALFGLTWLLWTPQTLFPQIPFLKPLIYVPAAVDWLLAAVVLVGLSGCLLGRDQKQQRFMAGLFSVAAIGMIALDQNRLQPWAYHFLILASLVTLLPPPQFIRAMRWIVISIYLYSAISKFDYQFVHSVGDQMLTTLTGWTGIELADPTLRAWIVIGFPAFEMLVGVLLIFKRTRPLGVVAAFLLHGGLIVIFGPWAQNQRLPVLVWNLFFMVQAYFLFCLPEVSEAQATELDDSPNKPGQSKPAPLRGTSKLGPTIGLSFALFVLLFPLTQWVGLCDHWPAWEVYAPRTSRVRILSSLPNFKLHNNNGSQTRSLNDISLDTLGVPVYPQQRFQIGVALALDQRHLDGRIRTELLSTSDRQTGERESTVLTGKDQLLMQARRFWLNTTVRKNW